jgi:hypothetical protein
VGEKQACKNAFILQIQQAILYPNVTTKTATKGKTLFHATSKKCKVIPYTRHEGIKRLKRYSSIHSQPRHQMEVSDEPHAPAALPPGEKALGTQ